MIHHGFAALLIAVSAAASLAEQPASAPPSAPPAAPALNQPAKQHVVTLHLGDPAPPLAAERFLKGEPFASFESGRVYVLEFWATWCAPCINAMPHLSELQEQYRDKGVTIVGVNISEELTYSDKTLERVQKFVSEQADRMGYTVVYDGGGRVMDVTWMKAAGRPSIPTTFVVDKQGRIAWIGHPMWLDLVLPTVVDGTWDPAIGTARVEDASMRAKDIMAIGRKNPAAALEAMDQFMVDFPTATRVFDAVRWRALLAGNRLDEAYAILGPMVDKAIVERSDRDLMSVALAIIDPGTDIQRRDLDMAMKAATAAAEVTENKNGVVFVTIARIHFLKGEYDKAVETQTMALRVIHPNQKDKAETTLEEYKAKLAEKK
jgi:thiol-disulfide isomerase/thioredoxin